MKSFLLSGVFILSAFTSTAQVDVKKILCNKYWKISYDQMKDVNSDDTLIFYSSKEVSVRGAECIEFTKDNKYIRYGRLCGNGREKKSWILNGTIIEVYFDKSQYRKKKKLWFKKKY